MLELNVKRTNIQNMLAMESTHLHNVDARWIRVVLVNLVQLNFTFPGLRLLEHVALV